MKFTLADLRSLNDLPADTVIDARSPSEFAEDHVPGAINLPSLSDAERAEVGTIYVQDDRFKARKIGAAYVARNVAGYLQNVLADKPGGWRPMVYCWRGGQRSNAFATILQQIGWRVRVLDGGTAPIADWSCNDFTTIRFQSVRYFSMAIPARPRPGFWRFWRSAAGR